jgi:hypothetical protein
MLNNFPEFFAVGLRALTGRGNETGGFCSQGHWQQDDSSRFIAAAGLFEGQNRAH